MKTKSKKLRQMTPGERLAEARKQLGLTQEAVARRVKSRRTSGTLSPTAIAHFENGRCSFSDVIAKRVAKAVRVDADWLMTG